MTTDEVRQAAARIENEAVIHLDSGDADNRFAHDILTVARYVLAAAAQVAALTAENAELRELLIHRMAVLKFERGCETCDRTAVILDAAPARPAGEG